MSKVAATEIDPDQPLSIDAVAGLVPTLETLDGLIAEASIQQHPYGKVWQRFDLDTFTELVENIARRGLDQDILLYQGMVLEGWHRYLACLYAKIQPKFSEFTGTDLEAADRVHASGVRRQATAEQRYASFELLCQACPAFRERYEQLRLKGDQQQQAGTPLSNAGQRVDVVGAKAKAVGVSRSTAAKVEQVKKDHPDAVAEIAAGKTSAAKELKRIKKGKNLDKPRGSSKAVDIPTDADEGVTTAPAQGSLLIELEDLTQRFQTIRARMDELDWSKENSKAWNRAEKAMSEVVNSIVKKTQEGFKHAKAKKPTATNHKQKAHLETMTIKKLKSLYGDHAATVLTDYLKALPRKKRTMQTYRIVKPLPDKEEFKRLQDARFTSTAAELVNSAFGEFATLAGEMSDWYDSMPESLQSGDKACAIEDANSVLESLTPPEVSERIGALAVRYLPRHDVKSRSSQRDDAIGRLQAVVDAVSACLVEEGRDDREEIKNLVDELENAISEAESVEFPGMY